MIPVYAAASSNGDLHPSGGERIAGFAFIGEVLCAGDHAEMSLLGRGVCGIAEGTLSDHVVADHRHLPLAELRSVSYDPIPLRSSAPSSTGSTGFSRPGFSPDGSA
jgi:hypothetical protein